MADEVGRDQLLSAISSGTVLSMYVGNTVFYPRLPRNTSMGPHFEWLRDLRMRGDKFLSLDEKSPDRTDLGENV